jgi:hypothetical protein
MIALALWPVKLSKVLHTVGRVFVKTHPKPIPVAVHMFQCCWCSCMCQKPMHFTHYIHMFYMFTQLCAVHSLCDAADASGKDADQRQVAFLMRAPA